MLSNSLSNSNLICLSSADFIATRRRPTLGGLFRVLKYPTSWFNLIQLDSCRPNENYREGAVEKWLEEMESNLFNIKSLCTFLGVSRATVYRLIAAGQIEPIHIGSSVRFTESEIKRFITRQQRESRMREVGF